MFLKYSQELRDFCGFDAVPDGSKFTRFKQDFLLDLQSMFDHLVDLTEPICQKPDSSLASMTIFDTSGIEAWVTENNPKYANRIIKQLKALLPVLVDFFQNHPLIVPKTFLGGAAFDAINIYKSLFEEIDFQKAFIPLKANPICVANFLP